ncbi:SIR2 family NAD-dependent protein deacylase [Adhaeribacter arboris]|nr:SIR2 family protein [Adhaeribacter arboris]
MNSAHLSALFNKIRNEDVTFWVGAGFSLYAGYKSGIALKEYLFDNLSKEEQLYINLNLEFTQFMEKYIELKGSKNSLIESLKTLYLEQSPKSIVYHKKLANVPHVKDIITTNYDRLFELAYVDKLEVIYKQEQIPLINKNKKRLFKIHGDLADPLSIIISETDYKRAASEQRTNLIWPIIQESIITKSIVFIGYNLEDSDINKLFNNIRKQLKNLKKEQFFIAPNISTSKIKNLKEYGIKYINLKGEDFIDELIKNINHNLISDYDKERISEKTLKDYLQPHQLEPSLIVENNKYRISGLKNKNPQANLLNVKLDLNEMVSNKFNDFIHGKSSNNIRISNKDVKDIQAFIGDIRIIDGTDFSFLELKIHPNFESKVAFLFLETDTELEDIPLKVYYSENNVKCMIEFSKSKLTIFLSNIRPDSSYINFKFDNSDGYSTTREELRIYTLLYNISKGQRFKAIFPEGQSFEGVISGNKKVFDEANYLKDYFTKLKIIENNFGFRFEFIDAISESTYNLVNNLVKVIEDGYFVYTIDKELTLEFKTKTKFNWNQISIKTIKITFTSEPISINLNNKKIELGYKIYTITNPVVVHDNQTKYDRVKVKNFPIGIHVSFKSSLNEIEKANRPFLLTIED